MPQSCKDAAVLFLKAADQGQANTQHNPGVLCAQGKGVSRNFEEAAVVIERQLTKDRLTFSAIWTYCTRKAKDCPKAPR